ncbi:uncharacterized protein LOC127928091 isoform X1 [Oncorhynchus keta]|uniref:uncharacterized protein LOC127928091 isoform X1 n=1 Tax=Oncorhynchus keta TaxID=8018 RepID=UPI00227C16CD|nr:uncharacterized protein LOC127928091 isoform X1 [Oncorhynchus keta]
MSRVLEWLYIQVSTRTLFNVQGTGVVVYTGQNQNQNLIQCPGSWSGCIYRSVPEPYSMSRVLEWLYIQVSTRTLFNVQGPGVVVYTGQYQNLIQCPGSWSGCIYRSVPEPYSMSRVLEWLYIQVSTRTLFNVQGPGVVVYTGQYQNLIQCPGSWSGCIYRSVPEPYSMSRVLEWLYIQVSTRTLFNVQGPGVVVYTGQYQNLIQCPGSWSGCIYRSVPEPYSMSRVLEWLYIQVSTRTLFNVQGPGVVVYTGQYQNLIQCPGSWSGCIYRSVPEPYSMSRVLEWLYIQVSTRTLFNVQGPGVVVYTGQYQNLIQCPGSWSGCIYRSVPEPYSMSRVLEWLYIQVSTRTLFNVQGPGVVVYTGQYQNLMWLCIQVSVDSLWERESRRC